jgi:hypothetical protein
METTRTTFTLSEALMSAFDEARGRVSRSAALREAMRMYIQMNGGEVPAETVQVGGLRKKESKMKTVFVNNSELYGGVEITMLSDYRALNPEGQFEISHQFGADVIIERNDDLDNPWEIVAVGFSSEDDFENEICDLSDHTRECVREEWAKETAGPQTKAPKIYCVFGSNGAYAYVENEDSATVIDTVAGENADKLDWLHRQMVDAEALNWDDVPASIDTSEQEIEEYVGA